MRIQGTQGGTMDEVSSVRGKWSAGSDGPQAGGAVAVVVSDGVSAIAARSAAGRSEQAQRISEIRDAIASGSYRIDYDRLAGRFADEELARAGRA